MSAKAALDKVIVTPANIECKRPEGKDHHPVPFTVKNNSNERIAYKWRSNFRDKFRMRPAFGVVNAGKEKTGKLTIKPFKIYTKRKYNVMYYSIHLAVVPKDVKVGRSSHFWKNKSDKDLANTRKIKIAVTFKGIDDEIKKLKEEEAEEEGDEDEEGEEDDEEGEDEEEEEDE